MRIGTCCHCPPTSTGSRPSDVELNHFRLCRRCAPGPLATDLDPRIYSTTFETEFGPVELADRDIA